MATTIDFVSGCIGGAVGVLIGHPFDTVKVMMQTSQTKLSAMSIIKNCSIPSLYQGIKAPLSGLAAINAIVFGVHGSIMRTSPTEKTFQENLLWNSLAGALAGMAQSIISSPMELLKTRAQILPNNTVWKCAVNIIKTEGGFRGLYRGFGITLARDCPAFATYFCTYEYLIEMLSRSKDNTPSIFDMLMAGGTAGTLSWLVIYPLDVIKSRIQADNFRYKSLTDCVRQTISQEGFSVLMRGCSPTLLRAFPSNGATFTVVTWILYQYESYENINKKELIQS